MTALIISVRLHSFPHRLLYLPSHQQTRMPSLAKRVSTPAWCAVSLLLIGSMAPPLPYGCYTFLRIVICIWGIYTITRTQKIKGFPFLISISITILYNPIIRIHLPREVWELVNIFTLALIILIEIIITNREK